MKNMKKLVTVTLIIVLCVVLYYRYANKKDSDGAGTDIDNGKLSEVEKILTKNLDEIYPNTPLEVVKFFTRIQKCYYNEENTDEVVKELAEQAKKLMDEELIKHNPDGGYFEKLNEEIDAFGNSKKKISNIVMDKTNDVVYSTVDGVKTAALNCTYYLQAGSKVTTTTEVYILRRNDAGQWKIYGWKLKEPSYFED